MNIQLLLSNLETRMFLQFHTQFAASLPLIVSTLLTATVISLTETFDFSHVCKLWFSDGQTCFVNTIISRIAFTILKKKKKINNY